MAISSEVSLTFEIVKPPENLPLVEFLASHHPLTAVFKTKKHPKVLFCCSTLGRKGQAMNYFDVTLEAAFTACSVAAVKLLSAVVMACLTAF